MRTVQPHIFRPSAQDSTSLRPFLLFQNMAATKQSKGRQAKVTRKFIINASQPASDKILDVSAFEKFLQDKIKVDGRVGNLGDVVKISQIGDGKIEVIAHTQFSGRYLKYLSKKFLKKQQLRDWLRVVSTSKGVYELRFFNVQNDDEEDDDDE
ncbi:60S ribosomal protein L22 [Golovinomyces cichoracearum]|uniref:60S ribosomal protein L22 n=1 Tax=Golovinomyces cichoracearum TaxID=62708 RepID=A0A420I8U8_9PEZI|nr:60S ribosomal protein L22 [Golovinomyces cichoracearum]